MKIKEQTRKPAAGCTWVRCKVTLMWFNLTSKSVISSTRDLLLISARIAWTKSTWDSLCFFLSIATNIDCSVFHFIPINQLQESCWFEKHGSLNCIFRCVVHISTDNHGHGVFSYFLLGPRVFQKRDEGYLVWCHALGRHLCLPNQDSCEAFHSW